MRKVSELLGKPLVCLIEGTNEGVIKNIIFEKKLKKPRWLILNDKTDEGELAVNINSVFRLGADAVIIKSRNELLYSADETEINNPINCDVFTSFGKWLGTVKDVNLHESKNEVVSLELADGTEIPVGQVFSGSSNTVIIQEEEILKVTAPKPAKPRKPAAKKTVKPAVKTTLPPQTNIGNPPPADSPLRTVENFFPQSPAVETDEEWTPPKPEMQKKLIGDYNFLLGRRTNNDIYNKQNEKIIKKNTLITREIVEKARVAGKLIDLTVRSLPEQYIY